MKTSTDRTGNSATSDYSIFDKMLEGVQVIDKDWRYIYINDAIVKQSKTEREMLLGNTMMEQYPGIENSDMFKKLRVCMEARKSCTFLNEFEFPDGSKGWFDLRMEPVQEGVLIMSFDISRQKQLEYELRELNKSLEQKIKERTIKLQEINEELESFTYTVSHDLRAPLRAVDGFAKVLRNKCSDELSDDAMNYLNIISNSVAKMSDLIDDLLTFSRVGRNQTNKAVFDLGKLFQETFDDLKIEGEDDEVELMIQDIPQVMADRDLLKHVTRNFVDNALKFSRGKNHRKIEIGVKQDHEKNIYYIKDNGVGFDTRYADKLFGMFERLHSEAEFEGTGVGLAIVQRIIHKHEGTVWAESELEKGSTFYFTLG